MAQRNVEATASRKVELAVGELESLSVPPCVAVQYLPKIVEGRFSPGSLLEIVECEPVLAAELLSLAQRLSAGPASQRQSIRLVLDRLDAGQVRDTLLSTKVTAAFEIEFAREQPAMPSHKDLTLHCLAVACAARRIAQDSPLQIEPDLAYSAGLLHDIGKFALQEIMPRSLASIAQEAEASQSSLYEVERRRIGTDHALLGKHLAQRWHLPEAIGLAVWLHHGDAAALLDAIPNARAALVVWAADAIARYAGIGQSGSHETPASLDEIARMVGVHVEALQRIQEELPEQVDDKSLALGFDLPNATARYCDLIQSSAAQLSRMHTQLTLEGRDSQMASGYLNLADEFLRGAGPNVGAMYMAEDFARRWQRFFQTGSVCLYWPAPNGPGVVEAVLVEALGHGRKIVLEVPPDEAVIPWPVAGGFTLMDARGRIDWLLEQIEVDFDPGRTKLVPLLCDGQTIAVLAFETNYPGDADLFAGRFEMAAAMAASVLGLALAKQRQERLLEQLAQTRNGADSRRPEVAPPLEPPAASAPALPLEALAEMAAGVAHELNNPLSVIAGRAQLLAQVEPDGQKRHVMDIIGDNAREAAGIVSDLMSFAEPELPRPTKVDVGQIVEEAVHLAVRKLGVEHVNTQVQVAKGIGRVLVDSGQVVSALAHVITNAVEAYGDTLGPVKITAKPADGAVRLQISDLGCGMDAETIRKATHPFFSAKPAGRKRGMGLAYADRFIRLNRGVLAIESQPRQGATVTITLPRT